MIASCSTVGGSETGRLLRISPFRPGRVCPRASLNMTLRNSDDPCITKLRYSGMMSSCSMVIRYKCLVTKDGSISMGTTQEHPKDAITVIKISAGRAWYFSRTLNFSSLIRFWLPSMNLPCPTLSFPHKVTCLLKFAMKQVASERPALERPWAARDELIDTSPHPAFRQVRQVGGVGRLGLLVLLLQRSPLGGLPLARSFFSPAASQAARRTFRMRWSSSAPLPLISPLWRSRQSRSARR
ncbi:MAG: hypothetical protein K0S81_3502 [Rhodospirillales bacterium]|nr:hypothetical protein [Rhodospirillales bacterium]